MRKLLTDYPDEPIYNMKAVEQQTGIPAATLRAWERRYALMEPTRTPNGYRLYSDRDVALLRWVRTQMQEGLTISRAVAMLETMLEGHDPVWVDDEDRPSAIRQDSPMPPTGFVQQLLRALLNFDGERADEIVEQAFSLYSMATVYVDVLAPTLVEVGEAWHRGDILVTTEHYASAYLRGRLFSILHAQPHRTDMPLIFVGCAPTERHEIGALIFALILRQQGFNAVYLGQDIPLDDLIKATASEHPMMVCLSASSNSTALLLQDCHEKLKRVESPTPLFAYGGQAFDTDPELRQLVAGHYLGADPRDAVNIVNSLLRVSQLSDRRY